MKKIDKHRLMLPTANTPSGKAFLVLAMLAAIVFLLFWFVGYDTPYDENPNFVSPLFTDVLLTFVAMVSVMAVSVAIWSVWRSLAVRGRGDRVVNNIQTKKIAYAVTIVPIALMLVTLALASTEPILINGNEYADGWWLRMAGMFVDTSLLLVAIPVVAILVFAMLNSRRR